MYAGHVIIYVCKHYCMCLGRRLGGGHGDCAETVVSLARCHGRPVVHHHRELLASCLGACAVVFARADRGVIWVNHVVVVLTFWTFALESACVARFRVRYLFRENTNSRNKLAKLTITAYIDQKAPHTILTIS